MTAPCGSCPWRIGASSERIPSFNEEKACCTLPSVASDGSDGFRPIMACHLSTEDDNRPCVGYIVSEDGWANLAVRLGAIAGRIDVAAIRDECEPLELYDTFSEMLAALVPERLR